jgi:exosortase C (VPDSG-CTERM-specific)
VSQSSTASEPSVTRQGHPSGTRPAGYAGFIVLLGLAFIKPLVDLTNYAAQTDLHSHILLIPFISGYLILIQRNQLPKEYISSLAWSLGPLFLGVASLIVARSLARSDPTLSQNDFLSLITFSFVCLVASGGFLILGAKWMTANAFPFAFLFFIIPLPEAILDWLESVSKLASAEAAAFLFSLVGVPVLRDGTVFQLPGIVIEVAQECSGIRSSWMLFITSLLTSYLFLRSSWRRAILVSLVIPLAILRNGLRILTIGLLCVQVSPQMINSVIHHRGGPLFFALSLVPLLLLLWWLRKGEQGKAEISKC